MHKTPQPTTMEKVRSLKMKACASVARFRLFYTLFNANEEHPPPKPNALDNATRISC